MAQVSENRFSLSKGILKRTRSYWSFTQGRWIDPVGFDVNVSSAVMGSGEKLGIDLEKVNCSNVGFEALECTPVKASKSFWEVQSLSSDFFSRIAGTSFDLKSMIGNDFVTRGAANFFEGVLLLGVNLSQCETITHMITIVIAYVNGNFPDLAVSSTLVDYIQLLFKPVAETQSGFNVKDMLLRWGQMQDCEIYCKFKKLIGSLVTAGVCCATAMPFSVEFYEKMVGAGAFASVMGSDVISYALEFFSAVVDRGIDVWNTGSIWALFSDSAMNKADADYANLMASKTHYLTSSIELSGNFTDEHAYCLTLTETIETYAKAIKRAKPLQVKAYLERKHMNLRQIEADIQHYDRAMSIRSAPFALLFVGQPGTGKTNMINEISNLCLRVNGFESTPDTKVSLNSNDKYQSEYRSHHKVVVLDDIANTSADKCQESPLRIIIDMINNDPKMALNADLHLKGRIAFKPTFVFGTTNIKHLQAGVFSVSPAAVLRRFNFIVTFKVKPEFAIPGTGMIDPAKMVNVVNDAWNFTIERAYPVPDSPSAVKYVVHKYGDIECTDVGLDVLFKVIGPASITHIAQQRELVARSSTSFHRVLCPHGSLAAVCSGCVALQDDDVNIDVAIDHLKVWYMKLARVCDMGISEKICSYLEPRGWNLLKKDHRDKFYASTLAIWASCVLFLRCVAVCTGFGTMWLSGLIVGPFATAAMGVIYNTTIKKAADYTTARIRKGADTIWKSNFLRIAAIVAIVGCMRRCYMAVRTVNTQGAMISAPRKDDEERPDPWVKAWVRPLEPVTDLRGATVEQLEQVLSNCLVRAEFHLTADATKVSACNLLPARSNSWFVPFHILKKGCNAVTITYAPGEIISPGRRVTFTDKQWVRLGDTDMCLLSLISLGSVRDLTPLFPLRYSEFDGPGLHISKDKFCETHKYKARYSPLQVKYDGIGTYTGVQYSLVGGNTEAGMCVAPLLDIGKRPYIVSLHTMGHTGAPQGVGAQILRSHIDEAVGHLYNNERTTNFEVASSRGFELQNKERGISMTGGLHIKSPYNYMDKVGSVSLYGSHTGLRRTFKSTVTDSYISESVERHMGVPNNYGPPKNISNWKPWHADASGLLDIKDVDHDLLELAYLDILDDQNEFLNKLGVDYVSERVHPLPIENILAGADGVLGVDRMDLNTSAGWPYNTPKKNFISEMGECVEGITSPLRADVEILEAVELLEKGYEEGYRAYTPFRVSLKDEPTKVAKEKVRTIAGSPIALTILTRKYFLMIIKFIRDHSAEFESAVGVNAYGPEWTKVAGILQKYEPDNNIAGDFKAYDTCMSCMMTYTGFKLLISVAKFAGFTDLQLKVMRGIATDICEPVYEFNGEFVQVNGSNASGHGLTVIINNQANRLYQRMGFYDVYDRKPSVRYSCAVSALNFGDDNVMNVHKDFPEFNHTSLQAALAKQGLVYTMADKLAPSIPYIPFSEVTFLKRSFVWNAELGQYVGPIEEASIHKNLHSSKGSKFLCPEELSAIALETSAAEYFLHGEEKYTWFVSRAELIVKECGLEVFMSRAGDRKFLNYREMVADYRARYPS
ncbi:hypothetical protein 1 [Shahe picorna-like virus 3]|uniref:hypothetical protein 1 n=1 Tax=Shahe picorna-like virus 3 TaxID=1923446 RepID=UPI00090B5AF9|nr:hypothetical protein 1 [Shahe picorna-like virus 3]APG77399.1 hypothetical protein 1 [Shahe picorna-like virus 3]